MKKRKQREKLFLEKISLVEEGIYAMCCFHGKTLQDAEDLYQDILLNIYTNIHRYKSDSNFSAWAYRISLNVIINYKRSKYYKSFIVLKQFGEEIYADKEQDTYEENIVRLYEQIALLPEDERNLMRLFLSDRTVKEISETLEWSKDKVYREITKIKQKLIKQNDK